MEIDLERRKLPARESQCRHQFFGGVFFGLPMALLGGMLLIMAFGPAELREEVGGPPFWFFAAPGVLVTILAVFLLGSGKREREWERQIEQARQSAPGCPWRWDHPWTGTTIGSAARRWTVKTVAFVVLGALFLTPFNWWAFGAGGPWPVKIVTLVFDLLLVLAIFTLVLATLRYAKYGDPRLQIDDFPAHLGQELGVRLERPRGLPEGARLDFTLRCIEEQVEFETERYREDGTWHTRQVATRVFYQLWSAEEARLVGAADPVTEVRIPLPTDRQLSTRLLEAPPRYWHLEVRGDAPGTDYHAQFLLPVYSRSASARV